MSKHPFHRGQGYHYTYTCNACGHLFRSEKAMAPADRTCGVCQLKQVSGERKENPK